VLAENTLNHPESVMGDEIKKWALKVIGSILLIYLLLFLLNLMSNK
jgi:hypothetical protein